MIDLQTKADLSSQIQMYKSIADEAIDLIFNNKINAKNAFDINNEFLENIHYLVDKNEESTWQKVSASLDASAKIYAFRVDSVHSETYRFLGGLSRNETKNNNTTSKSDEESIDDEEDNNYNDLKKLSKKARDFKTIENDHKKLEYKRTDFDFDVDPMFKNMTAKFNDSGAKGLLLKTLYLYKGVDILLEMNNYSIINEDVINSNFINKYSDNNLNRYSQFISNSQQNNNDLFDNNTYLIELDTNNLKSNTPKYSFCSSIDKNFPKSDSNLYEIHDSLREILFENETLTRINDNKKEDYDFDKMTQNTDKFSLCKSLEAFGVNTLNAQKDKLNKNFKNEELNKLKSFWDEEPDRTNYEISKADIESIRIVCQSNSVSETDAEDYSSPQKNQVNKKSLASKKSGDLVNEKLNKESNSSEELKIGSESNDLELNETIEINQSPSKDENLIEDKVSKFQNISNEFYTNIQNIGKGMKPTIEASLRNIQKNININATSKNLNLLGKKRLLNKKGNKQKKETNQILFIVENEVEEKDIFYKETRMVISELRNKKLKNIKNQDEYVEKKIRDNFNVCEGQLNINKEFKKSYNKIKILFNYNTEQLLHNPFIRMDQENNFIQKYLNNSDDKINELAGQKEELELNRPIIDDKDEKYKYYEERYKNIKIEEKEFNEIEDRKNFENLKKINSDYIKTYGKLYRTTDLRSLKNRIWNNLKNLKIGLNLNNFAKVSDMQIECTLINENFLNTDVLFQSELDKNINSIEVENKNILDYKNNNQQEISFKSLCKNTLKNMSPEMKKCVSDSTLFVCLLHLANEKNLEFSQTDESINDFKIRFNNLI